MFKRHGRGCPVDFYCNELENVGDVEMCEHSKIKFPEGGSVCFKNGGKVKGLCKGVDMCDAATMENLCELKDCLVDYVKDECEKHDVFSSKCQEHIDFKCKDLQKVGDVEMCEDS